MKPIYYILGGAAAVLGIAFLSRKDKSQEGQGDAVTGPPPPPPVKEPASPSTESPALYLDDFEVKSAIRSRINQYVQSGAKARQVAQAAGLYDGLFSGLDYPAGLQKVIADEIGNPYNIPILPDQVDPVYNQKWQFVKGLDGFEKMTGAEGSGFENALKTWKNALDFSGYGFALWPEPQDIEAGLFGPTKKGDRNRSERYEAFTKDTKKFSDNIQQAGRKLYEALEVSAIEDLKAAGWNIVA